MNAIETINLANHPGLEVSQTPPFATGDRINPFSKKPQSFQLEHGGWEATVTPSYVDLVASPDASVSPGIAFPHYLRDISRAFPLARHLFQGQPGELPPSDYRLPTVQGLNEFGADFLQPLGAHDLPLVYARGTGERNDFTAREITGALAAGMLLVGINSPEIMAHDLVDHGLSIRAVHGRVMGVNVAISQKIEELRHSDPEFAGELDVDMALSLDTETAFAESVQLSSRRERGKIGSQILTALTSNLTRHNRPSDAVKAWMCEAIREIDPKMKVESRHYSSGWTRYSVGFENSRKLKRYYDSVYQRLSQTAVSRSS